MSTSCVFCCFREPLCICVTGRIAPLCSWLPVLAWRIMSTCCGNPGPICTQRNARLAWLSLSDLSDLSVPDSCVSALSSAALARLLHYIRYTPVSPLILQTMPLVCLASSSTEYSLPTVYSLPPLYLLCTQEYPTSNPRPTAISTCFSNYSAAVT